MPRKNIEEIESMKLAQRLNFNKYLASHIANESWLPPKYMMLVGIKKKRMWLKKWFPDFLIILKRWSLLFIELKKPRNKKSNWEYYALSSDWINISEEQEYWVNELNKIDNVDAYFCFGFEDAKKLIDSLEKT